MVVSRQLGARACVLSALPTSRLRGTGARRATPQTAAPGKPTGQSDSRRKRKAAATQDVQETESTFHTLPPGNQSSYRLPSSNSRGQPTVVSPLTIPTRVSSQWESEEENHRPLLRCTCTEKPSHSSLKQNPGKHTRQDVMRTLGRPREAKLSRQLAPHHLGHYGRNTSDSQVTRRHLTNVNTKSQLQTSRSHAHQFWETRTERSFLSWRQRSSFQ